MWIFTRYGFYSLSVNGDIAWIRGRKKNHLQSLKDRFLLEGTIEENIGTDYKYRIKTDKSTACSMMYELAHEQDWSNFKNEVARYSKDRTYTRTLHDVWDIMYGIQE